MSRFILKLTSLFLILSTLIAATPLHVRQGFITPEGESTSASITSSAEGGGETSSAESSKAAESTSESKSEAGSSTVGAAVAEETKSAESSEPSSESGSESKSGSESSEKSSEASGGANLVVVQFAALAEILEATFYEEALKKFTPQDFTSAGFIDGQAIFDQLIVIRDDEKTHLEVLQSVAKTLGGDTSKTDSCTFNFDSALGSVETFLTTARVLEFVGVDAYIGGTTLITDPSLLVSATEITTVEARHNTILNLLNSGSSIPNAFDMVLTPQNVLSVAAPFISGGCDPVAALGLTPTPALTVTNTGSLQPGTTVTFGGAGIEGLDTKELFCNMIVGGASESLNFPISDCKVPEGIDGPVHIFITNTSKPLSSNIVGQDLSSFTAGPAIAFVDTVSNGLAQLLRSKGRTLNSESSSEGSNSESSSSNESSSSESGSSSESFNSKYGSSYGSCVSFCKSTYGFGSGWEGSSYGYGSGSGSGSGWESSHGGSY